MDSSSSPTSTSAVPMKNHDGTIMLDHHGRTIYQSQFLSTHPVRSDCKERVGYAGRKFTYLSGEGVIRTMNLVFGNTGWSSEVLMDKLVQCEKDEMGRWVIGYIAKVRISLTTGTSHEDFGSGEGINENKVKCHEKALKSAVTDALKRAARHLGDRLGNALYVKGSGIKTAPIDNKQAIDDLERKDAHRMFGDQHKLREKNPARKDVTTAETSKVETKYNNDTANKALNTETGDRFPTNSTKEQQQNSHVTNPASINQNHTSSDPKVTNNPYRRPISLSSSTSNPHNEHHCQNTPNTAHNWHNTNGMSNHVNRHERNGPQNVYPSSNMANANSSPPTIAQPSRISMEPNSNSISEGIQANASTHTSNRASPNLDRERGQTNFSMASKNMQSNVPQNNSTNVILNEVQQHQQSNLSLNNQIQTNRFSSFNYPSSSSSSSASSSPSRTAVITPNKYLAKNRGNSLNHGINDNGIHPNLSTFNIYTHNSSEENSFRKRQFNDENETIVDAFSNNNYVSNKRNVRNPYNR